MADFFSGRKAHTAMRLWHMVRPAGAQDERTSTLRKQSQCRVGRVSVRTIQTSKLDARPAGSVP